MLFEVHVLFTVKCMTVTNYEFEDMRRVLSWREWRMLRKCVV